MPLLIPGLIPGGIPGGLDVAVASHNAFPEALYVGVVHQEPCAVRLSHAIHGQSRYPCSFALVESTRPACRRGGLALSLHVLQAR